MNDCLYKGPDRFMNNLLSVCLGFRNGRVAAAADLSKFHNQVRLTPSDVHMQRFLWRDMHTDEAPRTYAVTVNNFGVKPANCIPTSALHKSADMYKDVYPEASRDIQQQTYVDDELVAAENEVSLHLKTQQMDEICAHAGMPNKGWTFSNDESSSDIQIGNEEEEGKAKILGLFWVSNTDMFEYQVKLMVKIRSDFGELLDIPISSAEEIESHWYKILLTRKVILSNVMKIFDPIGLLCFLILQSKLLLRETWNEKGLGWDDPLPKEQVINWLTFFKSLLAANHLQIPRSLWPEDEVDGLPIIIIFSDGSISACGAAAYIRWTLKDGSYWSRLIMAKSKIKPKRIVSVPRMELSGAVMGNRIKNFMLKETNFKFAKVYHLVDSSTVLGYIHKESSNFLRYEGIRIAEIQSTNEFQNDRLMNWAWVSGCENPADWCTKPRTCQDITESDFFHSGPPFIRTKEEDWPIKFSFSNDKLEGEIDRKRVVSAYASSTFSNIVSRLYTNCSMWVRIVRAMAWLLRLVPLTRRPVGLLTCDEVKSAKTFIVKEVQKEIEHELIEAADTGKGRFRKLAPVKDDDGVWRLGSRLRNFVPFTHDAKMPKILPTHHRITLLIMRTAHQFSHAGLDGTLSRFYAKGYWTIRAGHIARNVKIQENL